ncbi:MAG: hypothetical protein ACRCYY_12755 [Trueperaceae bacterium]
MRLSVMVLLSVLSFGFAQQGDAFEETHSLEFGTKLESLLNQDVYTSQLPQALQPQTFSMQYVYPSDATLYSMRFVTPDLTTEYSMYLQGGAETELEVIPESLQP